MKKQDLNQLQADKKAILLYDGVCNICNGYVQFLLKRDKKAIYYFASLQSETGQALLKKHNLPTDKISTVVMIENGKVYTKSAVGLRITRHMGGLWPVFYPLIFLPRFFRDFCYDIIAKNRYRWFGQKSSCPIPSAEDRTRFLDW